jgi:hypothetical protein
MKTVQEIRNKKLDILKGSLIRPRMYAHDQYGVEIHFLNILDDLSYIDEKESDLEIQLDNLREKGLMSPMRVAGRLPDYFSKVCCFSNEIASIYAEIAYNLGYFSVENLCVSEKWDAIFYNIKNFCCNQDRYVNDIITQFGKPSLEIGTIWCPIHVYVSEDHQKGWICFDYWNEDLNNFDREPDNRFKFRTNPILRNVRLPKEKFKNGMVYTPYGNGLK